MINRIQFPLHLSRWAGGGPRLARRGNCATRSVSLGQAPSATARHVAERPIGRRLDHYGLIARPIALASHGFRWSRWLFDIRPLYIGPMTDFETLRERHAQQYQALLPEHLARLHWAAEKLRSERQRRLRATIAVAKERSPWHRDRLAHLDAERATEADLQSIPPMSKEDLMRNFD